MKRLCVYWAPELHSIPLRYAFEELLRPLGIEWEARAWEKLSDRLADTEISILYAPTPPDILPCVPFLFIPATDFFGKNYGQKTAEAQIELAEIYLKLERPDQAIEILNQIAPEGPEAARVAPLMERARELKAAPTIGNKPPKVTR